MRTISMYNVGFGDCFLIKDLQYKENKRKNEQYNFLVDMGSLSGENRFSHVVSDVNYNLSLSKSNSLLITHFHEDHYNLIKKLDQKFDKIYIRNDFSIDNTIKLCFLDFMILKDIDPNFKKAYEKITKIQDINQLLKNNSKIIFVREGSIIDIGKRQYHVLSPAKNESLSDDLNNLIGKILSIEGADLIIKKLEVLVYYDLTNSKADINYDEMNMNSSYYDQSIHNQLNQEIKEKGLKEVIKIFISEVDEFKETNEEFQELIKQLSEDTATKIKDEEHKLNVSIISDDYKLLMFGDEYKKYISIIMKKLHDKKIYPNKIIKVAHHGTEAYYTDDICFKDNDEIVKYDYLLAPYFNCRKIKYDYRNDNLALKRFKNFSYKTIEDEKYEYCSYKIEIEF